MTDIRWECYPLLTHTPLMCAWLQIQAHLGLAPNTIDAYGRALEDYLRFCHHQSIGVEAATQEHVALYVHDLASRPHPHHNRIQALNSDRGLANATMQQRLTAIRLFYDYLVEEGLRPTNPVGRGRYTPGKALPGTHERGLIPRYHKLPWIPSEEQWKAILEATKAEVLRNRLMFAFAYDAALRREEVCMLMTSDIDPSHCTLRIRAETTKNRMERVIPYSEETSILYSAYLRERRLMSRNRGPLFLSESDRNLAHPISIWTWSKVVKGIAERSGVQQFTTHTLRHLCLTDLARSGWELHEIATFAGHRSVETTMLYIHLSARDLSHKLNKGMQSIHRWRVAMLAEELQ